MWMPCSEDRYEWIVAVFFFYIIVISDPHRICVSWGLSRPGSSGELHSLRHTQKGGNQV